MNKTIKYVISPLVGLYLATNVAVAKPNAINNGKDSLNTFGDDSFGQVLNIEDLMFGQELSGTLTYDVQTSKLHPCFEIGECNDKEDYKQNENQFKKQINLITSKGLSNGRISGFGDEFRTYMFDMAENNVVSYTDFKNPQAIDKIYFGTRDTLKTLGANALILMKLAQQRKVESALDSKHISSNIETYVVPKEITNNVQKELRNIIKTGLDYK
jgi:hypothetical protein